MKNNRKEQEMFYHWALTHHDELTEERYFPKINPERSSYYEEPQEIYPYCHEYSYETVDELKKQLEKMWGNDKTIEQILTAVVVSAFKNEPENYREDCSKSKAQENATQNELTTFIYNF